jgi:MFS family permease
MLTLTYAVSFVDRQIMALMIEPIRRDLKIGDTQVSLLIGLAFAIFYVLLGIPIGRLADRYSRRAIIASGIAIWCAMTAACGLARNYTQLFLFRLGVGVGEGSLGPAALSMISDYFPQRTRTLAIGIYNMGILLGIGLAMIVGGQLITYVTHAPPLRLPVIGELFAWQTVFIVVGLPGLLMAVLLMTIREPQRREGLLSNANNALQLSLAEVARYLLERWRMYASHFVGLSAVTLLAYALFAWVPTMFIRTWGWNIGKVGIAYGVVVLLAAPLSALTAKWLSEYLVARGYRDAQMRAALSCAVMAAASAVAAALSPSPWFAVVLLLPASIGTNAATACALGALMMITPNQMRAQASAIYYLVVNVVGLTIGPTGVALFTDYVFRDPLALRYSIVCIALLAGVFAAGLLLYNLRQFRDALTQSQAWAGAAS